jgi:hypothetical protein
MQNLFTSSLLSNLSDYTSISSLLLVSENCCTSTSMDVSFASFYECFILSFYEIWMTFFQERNRGKFSFWHINKFQGTDLPGFTTGFVEPAFVSDRPIYVVEQKCKSSDSYTVPITVGSFNARKGIVFLPCFLVKTVVPWEKSGCITSLTWVFLVGRVWGIILVGWHHFSNIFEKITHTHTQIYIYIYICM